MKSLAEHYASLRLQNVALGERRTPPTPRQHRNGKAKSGYEDAQQHQGKDREVKPAGSVELGQRRDQHIKNGHDYHAEQNRLGPATHMGSLMRLCISVISPPSSLLRGQQQNLMWTNRFRDRRDSHGTLSTKCQKQCQRKRRRPSGAPDAASCELTGIQGCRCPHLRR
jgi:hypothetical protein